MWQGAGCEIATAEPRGSRQEPLICSLQLIKSSEYLCSNSFSSFHCKLHTLLWCCSLEAPTVALYEISILCLTIWGWFQVAELNQQLSPSRKPVSCSPDGAAALEQLKSRPPREQSFKLLSRTPWSWNINLESTERVFLKLSYELGTRNKSSAACGLTLCLLSIEMQSRI